MNVTLSLFAGVGAQFFDNNGLPLSGGKIYTYNAGTTTPLATYTTNLGTIAQSNPIILDASGRIPVGEIWLTTGYGYKFIVQDANSVLIGTYDNVPSSAQPPITNDASSIYYELGTTVNAGSFIIGNTYLIAYIGSTNFQLIGASANLVGIHFIATGVGSGSGTAQISRTVQAALQSMPSLADFDNSANFNTYSNSLTNPINFAIQPKTAIRTLESKIQESVSVKDYGAVGDNSTDDTVAFQNAIASGNPIFVPPGTYKITSSLTFNPSSYLGQKMYGLNNVSGGQATLDFSSVSSGSLIVIAGFGTTLEGICITGGNSLVTGIEIENQSGFNTIRDFNFRGSFSQGITTDTIQCTDITNISFNGTTIYKTGIYINGGASIQLTNIQFSCTTPSGTGGPYNNALPTTGISVVAGSCLTVTNAVIQGFTFGVQLTQCWWPPVFINPYFENTVFPFRVGGNETIANQSSAKIISGNYAGPNDYHPHYAYRGPLIYGANAERLVIDSARWTGVNIQTSGGVVFCSALKDGRIDFTGAQVLPYGVGPQLAQNTNPYLQITNTANNASQYYINGDTLGPSPGGAFASSIVMKCTGTLANLHQIVTCDASGVVSGTSWTPNVYTPNALLLDFTTNQ